MCLNEVAEQPDYHICCMLQESKSGVRSSEMYSICANNMSKRVHKTITTSKLRANIQQHTTELPNFLKAKSQKAHSEAIR